MNRVEDAYRSLCAQLEAQHGWSTWTDTEREHLMHLLAGAAPPSDKKDDNITSSSSSSKSIIIGNHTHSENAPALCNTNDGDDDDDATAAARETMWRVDCALTDLRALLQRLVPFGSLHEPTHATTTALSDATPSPDMPSCDERAVKETTCAAAPVYAVDSFLYPEEDIEALVQGGLLAREYCRTCGSTNIGLTEFITHSFSQDQLVYLAVYLIPVLLAYLDDDDVRASTTDLVSTSLPRAHRHCRARSSGSSGDGVTAAAAACLPLHCDSDALPSSKGAYTVLDVGSRLGVVLWACYSAVQAGRLGAPSRLVGVEQSAAFVSVQQTVWRHLTQRRKRGRRPYGLSRGRDATCAATEENEEPPAVSVEVVESSCFAGSGALALMGADVIILHNVFEYFCSGPEAHLQQWQQLRAMLQSSADATTTHGRCVRARLLICSPSLHETFAAFDAATLQRCGIATADSRHREEQRRVCPRTRGDMDEAALGKTSTKDGCAHAHDCGCGSESNVAKLHPAARKWIDDFVTAVDVHEVQQRYLRHRHDGAAAHTNGCGAGEGSSEEQKEESSVEDAMAQELMERVTSMYVYRVRPVDAAPNDKRE